MHSEISKKENIFGFFGYDICKNKSLTLHTYVPDTTHSNYLGEVDPIASLRPRILFIFDELMS
jgi:hypothetical protein